MVFVLLPCVLLVSAMVFHWLLVLIWLTELSRQWTCCWAAVWLWLPLAPSAAVARDQKKKKMVVVVRILQVLLSSQCRIDFVGLLAVGGGVRPSFGGWGCLPLGLWCIKGPDGPLANQCALMCVVVSMKKMMRLHVWSSSGLCVWFDRRLIISAMWWDRHSLLPFPFYCLFRHGLT